jgi:hypothetical protein
MNPIPIRLANDRHLYPEATEDASALEEPAHGSDECVVVGFDDRRPGDDEDVPAGLERGRHHPERLTKSPPDTIPHHGTAELLPGR